LLGGGFPKNHVIAVIGPCGTGKSMMALQFIYEGLKNNEPGIFISLDESEEGLKKTATAIGLDLDHYAKEQKLALVKLDASDVMTSVTRIESDLPPLIKSFGAQRIVIDPVSLIEMLFTNESERRGQLFNLCEMIKQSEATALLTSESNRDDPYTSKFGLLEYVVDGVIVLRFIRQQDLREAVLAMEVLKMRRCRHSREIKPYAITDRGIEIYIESEVF
ncbi:MAG: KaiC domain-containing protein, partial [Halobacteria archaeon]